MSIKLWYSIFIHIVALHDLPFSGKLISEGTFFDTNFWITERGGELVIDIFNPFNYIM
jgi:hypothetical protein